MYPAMYPIAMYPGAGPYLKAARINANAHNGSASRASSILGSNPICTRALSTR